jgi:molybdopterin-guanine dinucleotide biosynthesis protein B
VKTAPLAPSDPSILAVAADFSVNSQESAGRPVFDLNDVTGLADFIAGQLSLSRRNG